MRRRCLSLLLAAVLLLGLCACGSSDSSKTPAVQNNIPTKIGALNILAEVKQNYTMIFDAPYGNVVTTLYYGDQVRIYKIDGDWAETNEGWVMLSKLEYDENTQLSTVPVETEDVPETTSAVISNDVVISNNDTQDETLLAKPLRGTVTGDSLRIRNNPGDGQVVGKLNTGDGVTISYITHVSDTLWCYIGNGWISMDFVKLPDFNIHAGFAAYFKAGTKLYSDPGSTSSNYSQVGNDGFLNIWRLYTVGNMVWGYTSGGWVNMNDSRMPGGVRIMTGY